MSAKRTSEEAHLRPLRTRRADAKRSKMSPSLPSLSTTADGTLDTDKGSDELSRTCSDASTILSSASVLSATTAATAATSISAAPTVEESEDESDSSSDSSSDDDDDDDDSVVGDEADAEFEEDEEYIAQPIASLPAQAASPVPPQQKPTIDPAYIMAYAKDLREKLHAFLPMLQKANDDLADHGAKLNMEHVEDDEQHIEMNLGLGVLERKPDDDAAARKQGIHLTSSQPVGDAVDPALLAEAATSSISTLISGSQDPRKPSISVLEDH